MLTAECCGVSAEPSLCYTTCSTSHFDPRYASFQRICGLLGPRSHQKADCWRAHRDQKRARGHREGPCLDAGRVVAGRPHQRRGACHSGSLFRGNAPYRRQLPGDVSQGEERTDAQVQGGAVRVSRDKVNKVAHVVADALAEIDAVDFVEDRNTIRLEIRKILEDLLNQEARIDQAARLKIESQKRTILEGSQEWDILYRKYYNEEVKKLGV